MTSLIEWRDSLAAVVFDGVTTVYPGIPKELFARELPASWVGMPSQIIDPAGPYSTFEESGVTRSVRLTIAVSEFDEGFPREQMTAVLEMAQTVEAWAKFTPWRVEMITGDTSDGPNIRVGSREYRGVVARIIGTEDI